ncbi:glycosyltransferase 87 family protein [Kineococcus esterisolvens]|uniref:glycosyltransferase 87 family protein n=1 Tax=unclassified Kineococcus TaxID=2621656 RepID=UPI003D7C62D7
MPVLRRGVTVALGLARHRAGVAALWSAASVCLFLRTWQGAVNAFDFLVVHTAARSVLAGQDPYADPLFLYLPSSALLTLPVALLPPSAAAAAAALACVAAVVVVCWSSARLLAPGSPPWLVPLTLLVVLVSPAGGALTVSANTEFFAVAALPVLYRWAADGRWRRFGVLLGITLAVKPILLALVVLAVLARSWRAVAWAAGIPAAASAAGLAVMPGGHALLPVVLERMAHGSPEPVSPWMEVSLAGVLRNGAVGPEWILLARVLVLLLGAAAVVVRWSRGDAGTPRTVQVGTLLVLTSVVGAPLAWDHYAVLLVPLFASAADGLTTSRHRRTVLWCSLPLAVLLVPRLDPVREPFGYGFQAGTALLVVLLVLCVEAFRAPRRPFPHVRRTVPGRRAHRVEPA